MERIEELTERCTRCGKKTEPLEGVTLQYETAESEKPRVWHPACWAKDHPLDFDSGRGYSW